MMHIRFEGRSFDVEKARVGVAADMCDDEIRGRVARWLEVSTDTLRHYVIDRSATGAIIVRPEAVYG